MPCSNAPDPDPPPIEDAQLAVLREEDLDQIVAIERTSFACPWPRESFCGTLHGQSGAVDYVVRCAQKVVAYACVVRTGDRLKINNLAVHRDDRRRGVGRWLLRRVLARARDEGCAVARLEVRASNRAALRLYRAQGFREIGRAAGYYQHDGEDAVLMEVPL